MKNAKSLLAEIAALLKGKSPLALTEIEGDIAFLLHKARYLNFKEADSPVDDTYLLSAYSKMKTPKPWIVICEDNHYGPFDNELSAKTWAKDTLKPWSYDLVELSSPTDLEE